MKKYNFSAGPAILPQEVFQEASRAVLDFEGMGLSILEISHRSKEFQAVMDEAMVLAKELLNVPDNYEALFLQGGASQQFLMVPYNFLGENEKAGYVDTGSWSSKAIKEAKRFGETHVLASSKEAKYTFIPKDYHIPEDLKYLHITSNNTIYGTEYSSLPATNVPFVADMSSNIFSRSVDVSKYAVIYAGAQKNMGPAGTTLVIVDKDYMAKQSRSVPSMLDYNIHIDGLSMYNTPPVFAVYVSMLTMRWIKAKGGVAQMHVRNLEKADKLYSTIDNSDLFYGPAKVEDRSLMNVNFLLKNDALQKEFLALCDQAGCDGVKGHRSVGGFRASIYNAMDMEGINVLCDVINSFDQTHG